MDAQDKTSPDDDNTHPTKKHKIDVPSPQSEPEEQPAKKIAYIYSEEYSRLCAALPIHRERSFVVHGLLEAYGLLNHVDVIPPEPASIEELTNYHSDEYISNVKKLSKNFVAKDESKEGFELRDGYGLTYDCPPFPKMFEYISMVAGASITAAKALSDREYNQYNVAINTEGGRHQRKQVDIVLSILSLLDTFDRVLYIDIDIHHGDGVEEAFFVTNKVATLSIHKYDQGFFPGTGKANSVGTGRGKNYNEIDDKTYFRIFSELTSDLLKKFSPDVVVLQCGCDTITGDPLGAWNLTPKVVGQCVKHVVDWQLPTLVLGGGGYKATNASRVWAYILDAITASVTKEEKEKDELTTETIEEAIEETITKTLQEEKIDDKEEIIDEKDKDKEQEKKKPEIIDNNDEYESSLSPDIPEHRFFALYGPDFRLPIERNSKKEWKEEEIQEMMALAKQTIAQIQVQKKAL